MLPCLLARLCFMFLFLFFPTAHLHIALPARHDLHSHLSAISQVSTTFSTLSCWSSKIRHRTPARVRRSPGVQCTPPQQHPSRHGSPLQVRDVCTASVKRQVRSAIMPSSLTHSPTHQRSHIKLYHGSSAPYPEFSIRTTNPSNKHIFLPHPPNHTSANMKLITVSTLLTACLIPSALAIPYGPPGAAAPTGKPNRPGRPGQAPYPIGGPGGAGGAAPTGVAPTGGFPGGFPGGAAPTGAPGRPGQGGPGGHGGPGHHGPPGQWGPPGQYGPPGGKGQGQGKGQGRGGHRGPPREG